MKSNTFPEVADTNDDIEDITEMRNIGYANSKWWWATATGASNTVKLLTPPVAPKITPAPEDFPIKL